MNLNDFIAVTDSGAGGITTLCALKRLMPNENYAYFADRKYAPYGPRKPAEVAARQFKIADFFWRQGVKALVVACNTATNVCIDRLRAVSPVPVIGTEPALKPAVRAGGRTIVLATPLTLKSPKFLSLTAALGGSVTALPQPELATAIERHLDDLSVAAALLPWETLKDFDNIVLGCTHYIFLKPFITAKLPGVKVFDGNEGIARRCQSLLALRHPPSPGGGAIRFIKEELEKNSENACDSRQFPLC